MGITSLLKYTFKHKLGDDGRTGEHRQIILRKKFLKRLYQEWYLMFSERIRGVPDGKYIEIGSGGGFIKEYMPQVITSDITPFLWTDETYSALEIPYADNTVSAIFMIDTFHHLPDAKKFLSEVSRILMPGGKMIMVEPANSGWGRFIYRNFHHEPFDTTAGWTLPDAGPLTGANGALPWIVFARDRDLFEQFFPDLRINLIKYHTPLRYLLSGGVSYKGVLPEFSFPFFRLVDNLLSGLNKNLSMFFTIEVEKV